MLFDAEKLTKKKYVIEVRGAKGGEDDFLGR